MKTAVAYLGDMDGGVSRPKKMLCDDGVIRVVKFNHPIEWNRSLLNEFIGHRLAKMIEAPVIDQILVNVPEELSSVYSGVEGMSSGIKVGSPLVSLDNNLSDRGFFSEPLMKLYSSCINLHQFPSILAFDIWAHNNDRGSNQGNLLIIPEKDGRKKIYIHDHGFALVHPLASMERFKILSEFRGASLNWQDHKYPFGPVYEALKYNIDISKPELNPFFNVINMIQSVSRVDLHKIIQDVPKEWNIPDYELMAIESFLYDRRFKVRECIDHLIRLFWFPNWFGGDLNWQDLLASSE